MTKQQMVYSISDKTGVEERRVRAVVQLTLDSIIEILVAEQRLELRDFGVFEVRKRTKRKGRNPKTGALVDVPERQKVAFFAGMHVLARLNAQKPSESSQAIS